MNPKAHIAACCLLTLAATLAGCGSRRPAVAETPRVTRPPLVEVEESELEKQDKLIEAKMQEEAGNVDRALSLYRELLQTDPNYGAANYEMGRLQTNVWSIDSALFFTERAVKAAPQNVWYRLQAAQLYRASRQDDKLTAEWETIVEQNPEVLEYYYELSNAYIQAGKLDRAIEVLNRVERRIGVTEPIALQKQKLWLAQGKEKQAVKEVEALSEATPHETKYNAILAETYMKTGDYKKAKTYYDKILQANPEDEYIHISLAQYYKKVGNSEEAYRELKRGFASPALECQTKLQILGSFYSSEEFYGSESRYAFELVDDALQGCSDSTAYALFYGDVLMKQQKFAEAAAQFRIHLAHDSSQYEVWEALLICESMSRERTALVDHAHRASALFPLHILPYHLLGYDLLYDKRYSEAADYLHKCEQIGFANGYLEAETYELLADCYHGMGNDSLTFAYFDKALQLRPDNVSVLNNYAYYLAERGWRLDDAERMAARAVAQEPDNANYLDTYAWVLYRQGKKSEAAKYMKRALKAAGEPSETYQQHWESINQ